MKHLRRILCLLWVIVVCTSTVSARKVCSLSSPNTGIRVRLEMLADAPYLVIKNASGQLAKVRMGFEAEENFASDLKYIGATKPELLTENYHVLHGKCANPTNQYRRQTIHFVNSQKTPFSIEVRAYDNGVVFRYILPDDAKTHRFADELTSYEMPQSAHRWLMPFNTSYEADFPYQAEAGKTGVWGFPALFETNGTFVLLTEANIGRSYCSTHLDNTANPNHYKVSYPFSYEGYNRGETNPSWTGSWTSPWRVLMIGSLKTIVESTLIEDVSDPCKLSNTDFVKPGRAAWVYWAYNHGTRDYQICCKYVDLAETMGWEYVLFDWEWESMENGGNLEDAVRYAYSKGVKPMIWYHSNNPKMQNHEERVEEFKWLSKIGVVGIKVDFFESDKQHTMQYFADILEDAAQFGILVNFHGCTVPRGWSRTYPHLISQEAVFGAEQYNNGGTMTTEGARINCLLTYTRNVIGPMDYTPVAFTHSQHPHTTSFAHELALSVAFESGIQHWADRPEGFLNLPDYARQFMREVPVAWDETRFLMGYPGKSFVVARRKGARWYVGGLQGEDKTGQFNVPLDFLGEGQYEASLIGDGATITDFEYSKSVVDRKQHISVRCQPKGGFVITLEKR
ncbi:MAG: glycoside hydrolase family 97 catalytic domain-containing protein [Bacteroidaceae bacterium]|nr:glycoside hydrolase family 97 catalytic domain-containing protein [Bacteroidaceae bacterium]